MRPMNMLGRPAAPAGPAVPYMSGLDGLRAIAVLAVIVYHADATLLGGGFLGVEVFFVISGYLITLLLIAERERTGTVSLRAFWMRRARRLLPALWAMMVGLVLWCTIFYRDPLGALRGDFVAGATYVTNWFQIWTGSSYTADLEFAGMRHLWSLAVEEQFYVVWPVVMFLVLRRLTSTTLPTVGLWFVSTAIAITAWSSWLYRPGALNAPSQKMSLLGHEVNRIDFLYLGSVSRASGLLLGAALAMFWRPWSLERARAGSRAIGLDVVAVGGIVALAAMHWFFRIEVTPVGAATRGYDLLFRGGLFLVGLATVSVVAAAVHPRSVVGRFLLGNPVLSALGRRSYGLYLYHWPIFQLIRGESTKTPLAGLDLAVAALATVAVSEISYRFLERPVREGRVGDYLERVRTAPYADVARLRRRVAILATGVGMLPVFAVVSLVRSPLLDSSINRDLASGNSFTSTVLPPVTDPSGTTNPSSPTTVPAVVPEVLAVGDSVMLGAAQELAGQGIAVDADEERLFSYAEQIFYYLRSVGQLSETIVIHLGTNNGVTESVADAVLAPLAQVDRVLVLNNHAPGKAWEAESNAVLAALPSRYPNVTVLDWKAVASANPAFLASDKIHLNGPGRAAYVTFIAEALGRPPAG